MGANRRGSVDSGGSRADFRRTVVITTPIGPPDMDRAKFLEFGYAPFQDTALLHVFSRAESSKFKHICEYLSLDLRFKPLEWARLASEIAASDKMIGIGTLRDMERWNFDSPRHKLVSAGPPLFVFKGHFIFARKDFLEKQGIQNTTNIKEEQKRLLLTHAEIATEVGTDLEQAVRIAAESIGVNYGDLTTKGRVKFMATNDGLQSFINGKVHLFSGGLLQSCHLLENHKDICFPLFRPEEIQLSSTNSLLMPEGLRDEYHNDVQKVVSLFHFAICRVMGTFDKLKKHGETVRELEEKYLDAFNQLGGGQLRNLGLLLSKMFKYEAFFENATESNSCGDDGACPEGSTSEEAADNDVDSAKRAGESRFDLEMGKRHQQGHAAEREIL